MTENEDKYCPQCISKITEYLGKDGVYKCHICNISIEKERALDWTAFTHRQSLLGVRNYEGRRKDETS